MTGDDLGRLPGSDLLVSPEAAEAWLSGAAHVWQTVAQRSAPTFRLTGEDMGELRDFRSLLFDHVAKRGASATPVDTDRIQVGADAHIALSDDGSVTLSAVGSGSQKVVSWILLEIDHAQRDTTWARLKACKNTRCRAVFYDNSRNASGVWHDVRSCGNVANLKAARERKRCR